MPFLMTRILALATLVGSHSMIGLASEPGASSSVQAENLLREAIAGVEGKEVIVSRVSFPPHTELPWHWHPGEEFFLECMPRVSPNDIWWIKTKGYVGVGTGKQDCDYHGGCDGHWLWFGESLWRTRSECGARRAASSAP